LVEHLRNIVDAKDDLHDHQEFRNPKRGIRPTNHRKVTAAQPFKSPKRDLFPGYPPLWIPLWRTMIQKRVTQVGVPVAGVICIYILVRSECAFGCVRVFGKRAFGKRTPGKRASGNALRSDCVRSRRTRVRPRFGYNLRVFGRVRIQRMSDCLVGAALAEKSRAGWF